MGGFLTIGYCLRTIDYCFPLFSGNFVDGDKGLMEGQSRDGGIPPVSPTRENPAL